MPNTEVEYVPRNTWAHISEGECEGCSRPRDLYANSCVAMLVLCTHCLVQSMIGIRDSLTMQMGAADTPEKASELEPHYYQIRAEYSDMRQHYDAMDIPAYSEGRCRSCHNPIIEGAIGSWAGITAHDREMNEYLTHRTCTTSCDDCDKNFIAWNTAQLNNESLPLMSYERYLGTRRCEPCVLALVADYGGLDNFFYCEQCDSYELRDESYTYNDNRYCETCYDNCVGHCEDCDDHYWTDDGHHCDDGLSNLIHDYSYRPRTHFFGDGKYHFGFELEVESNHDSRREGAEYVVNNLGNHAYLKQDGSLNNGFEIVTHPHTLEEYQKKFNWGCISGLGERGYRSWNTRTCGLHVHVSRTAFGNVTKRSEILKAQSHELRFIKLIYDNQRQIERIAGRSSSYAKFNDKGNLANRVKYGTQDDRYEAVNSQNQETLEIRVFKGSLKPARVLSAIELVHASVEYTRDLKVSGSNNALKWIHFVRYVADNSTTYPNLVSTIQTSFDRDTEPQNDNDDN